MQLYRSYFDIYEYVPLFNYFDCVELGEMDLKFLKFCHLNSVYQSMLSGFAVKAVSQVNLKKTAKQFNGM